MSELSPPSQRPTMRISTLKIPPKVSPPCSKRLRSDLLIKLGIVDSRSQAGAINCKLPISTSVKSQKTILGPNIKIIKAPLKQDLGPDLKKNQFSVSSSLFVTLGSFFRVGSPSSVCTTATMDSDDASAFSSCSASEHRRRSLTFDEQVSVVEIPRREQYSKRIQEHMWNSAEVLQSNVMRNTIEYAADGWNWEAVCEEDQHIVCRESGELIHPVHQEIARLIRQEQGLPEDTPVWTPFLMQAPLGTCTSASPATY